ncbi:methylated-DNA--[protein]-cysteine S-methyltransferase [Brevibacterium linens]|nr:methylated-DNA--[protein]-cysteine S-methyltransferase [Brevibacterium linens]
MKQIGGSRLRCTAVTHRFVAKVPPKVASTYPQACAQPKDGHTLANGHHSAKSRQNAVWRETRIVLTTLADAVPAGTTVTYGQLAEASGTGIPARTVGGIMGLNPIPIIVPCHRVVAGSGLGGYSGGLPGHELETKRRLLEFEGALPQPLF